MQAWRVCSLTIIPWVYLFSEFTAFTVPKYPSCLSGLVCLPLDSRMAPWSHWEHCGWNFGSQKLHFPKGSSTVGTLWHRWMDVGFFLIHPSWCLTWEGVWQRAAYIYTKLRAGDIMEIRRVTVKSGSLHRGDCRAELEREYQQAQCLQSLEGGIIVYCSI